MEKAYLYEGSYLEFYYGERNVSQCLLILDQMNKVNRDSGRNFSYGVFRKGISKEELVSFFERSIVCLIKDDERRPIGFFYNFILEKNVYPVVHQGLVVVSKNPKIDLIYVPYSLSNILMMEVIDGDFAVTNISSTPLIIGAFTELFERVWPSHRSENQRIQPVSHRLALNQLKSQYIEPFFPESKVDFKRSILISPLAEMGFEENIKEMPRHHDLMVNLFTQSWIDHDKGEDILQVGYVTSRTVKRMKNFIKNKVQEIEF